MLVAALLWVPLDGAATAAILAGAALITLVGALDDLFDLHPAIKLAGQVAAVAIPVLDGVDVERLHAAVHRPPSTSAPLAVPLTMLGLVLS